MVGLLLEEIRVFPLGLAQIWAKYELPIFGQGHFQFFLNNFQNNAVTNFLFGPGDSPRQGLCFKVLFGIF